MRRLPRTDRDQAARFIYRRDSGGRYYIDLRNFGGGREALIPPGQTYATRDVVVAIDLAATRLRQALDETRTNPFGGRSPTVTIGEFAHQWLDHRRQRCGDNGDVQPTTLDRYERALTQLFRVLDQDLRIDRVTKADVKEALTSFRRLPSRLGGQLSPSSARQAIAAMQQCFDHAGDLGAVPEGFNPWRHLRSVDRPRTPKGFATDFLEGYEAHAMLEASDRLRSSENPIRGIFAALILTGGRRDEVLGLELDDVDFRRDTLEFRTNRWRRIKTGESRTIRLWPQLKCELLRHIAASRIGPGLLFPSTKSRLGRQVMIRSIRRPFLEMRDLAATALGPVIGARLRAKAVHARALRPTYCAARLQTVDGGKAIAPWTVREEMGHASLSMITRVYGRLGHVRHRSDVVEFVALDDATRRQLQDRFLGSSERC